jgi:hypothetical protein
MRAAAINVGGYCHRRAFEASVTVRRYIDRGSMRHSLWGGGLPKGFKSARCGWCYHEAGEKEKTRLERVKLHNRGRTSSQITHFWHNADGI